VSEPAGEPCTDLPELFYHLRRWAHEAGLGIGSFGQLLSRSGTRSRHSGRAKKARILADPGASAAPWRLQNHSLGCSVLALCATYATLAFSCAAEPTGSKVVGGPATTITPARLRAAMESATNMGFPFSSWLEQILQRQVVPVGSCLARR
jgi:hypothetical protein